MPACCQIENGARSRTIWPACLKGLRWCIRMSKWRCGGRRTPKQFSAGASVHVCVCLRLIHVIRTPRLHARAHLRARAAASPTRRDTFGGLRDRKNAAAVRAVPAGGDGGAFVCRQFLFCVLQANASVFSLRRWHPAGGYCPFHKQQHSVGTACRKPLDECVRAAHMCGRCVDLCVLGGSSCPQICACLVNAASCEKLDVFARIGRYCRFATYSVARWRVQHRGF